jgi:cytoskeleton protein RodZ
MSPMAAIGDTLREARMRQKIDISEVEAKTKIRAKYLRALENEEFDLLPGPTFVRSFLRTYAGFLGLDAQLLVEEFRVQHEVAEEPEVQPLTAPAAPPRERRYRGGRPSPGVLIGGGLAALVVFLLILGLTGGNEENGSNPTTTVSKGRQKERKPKRQPAAATPAKPAPARVTLRVAPVDATYVCVDDGRGKVVFEGIIEDPRTFHGKRLRINLGKRSAKVRVNGKRVPITPGAEPVGFAFTPRGEKELPSGQRPCA